MLGEWHTTYTLLGAFFKVSTMDGGGAYYKHVYYGRLGMGILHGAIILWPVKTAKNICVYYMYGQKSQSQWLFGLGLEGMDILPL